MLCVIHFSGELTGGEVCHRRCSQSAAVCQRCPAEGSGQPLGVQIESRNEGEHGPRCLEH